MKNEEEFQTILKGDDVVEIPGTLPLIAIRDQIVYPYSVVPLIIGREKSLRALGHSAETDDMVLLAAQKDPDKEDIAARDIYRTGTVARVLQVMELPNGLLKVVVEGIIRAKIKRFRRNSAYFQVDVEVYEEGDDLDKASQKKLEQMLILFEEYTRVVPDLPEELNEHIKQQGDPYRMIDFAALHVQAPLKEKQQLLEEANINRRLDILLGILEGRIGVERLRAEIDQQVQENLIKNQRDYYLQEKLRIIKQELGEEDEQESPEINKLAEAIRKAGMPKHARQKADEELGKLRKIPPFSPEYSVIRNYLDWLIQVPWKKRTRDELDIRKVKTILDADHYGLEKPKERIIEFLAVLQRVKSLKGPILCFVGPPGVGKTSLGRSIARAMGRQFVRISLGGVRDEAEIRGHRRTYIGSMPGKIIQSMKRAGTVNPVFLLDEIDKMSYDFRGDPSAALLEVLDPEQNKTFNDHYLEVDYDLSNVFFITTANVRSDIPLPLQDRMEIIELPGYLEHEKLEIAKRHLLPRQIKENGLKTGELTLTDEAILRIIREYTREAGVRNLERHLAKIARKTVRKLVENGTSGTVQVTDENLEEFLGKPEFLNRQVSLQEEVGIATGLAWTPYGGDVLKIEVNIMPGKGKLILTGKLGDVMQESARTALSYLRSIADEFHIARDTFEKNDIHIHIPEGAIPKDGPSAGITLATALLSALTGKAVRNDVAMTGEITLRGRVLAIGGLKEKMLAAQRHHIRRVLVPEENIKDVEELPPALKSGIDIVLVKDFKDVLQQVMVAN